MGHFQREERGPVMRGKGIVEEEKGDWNRGKRVLAKSKGRNEK
jgi:hypothetical protein